MQKTDLEDADLEPIMEARRDKLKKRKLEIEVELQAINKDLRRIEAFLNPPPEAAPGAHTPTPSGKSSRAPRGERGRVMREIHTYVNSKMPKGANSDAIALGIQLGDKKGKTLIGNLLSRMKKEGYLNHSGVKGSEYTIGPKSLPPLDLAPSEEEAA